MKVKELIELLNAVDQELDVQTEGCDCYGDPISVRVVTLSNLKEFALVERDFS